MGCYSILDNSDEIRFYSRDAKLDNTFMKSAKISAQLLLLNVLRDRLITFSADARITVYSLHIKDNDNINRKYLFVKAASGFQVF